MKWQNEGAVRTRQPQTLRPDFQNESDSLFAAVAAGQVAADIRVQLGRHVDEYRSEEELVPAHLKEGIAVRVTRLLDGFEFNPPFQIILLYEPWHGLDFRL
jgi:hypothetical protein